MQDHPRLRGEHQDCVYIDGWYIGSPPPTRGTQLSESIIEEIIRITPAYAGNTFSLYGGQGLDKDHPRLRGEHTHTENFFQLWRGSPPPTRGTLIFRVPFSHFRRITPAYAGNTEQLDKFYKYYGDHPRLRGEHIA